MRKFVFICFILSFTITGEGQQIFELRSDLPHLFNACVPSKEGLIQDTSIICTGLLVLDIHYTGFIRWSWYDKQKQQNVIIDMDVNKDAKGDQGIIDNDEILVLRAGLSRIVMGKPDFNPGEMFIWLHKNNQTAGKFVPISGKIPFNYLQSFKYSYDDDPLSVPVKWYRVAPDDSSYNAKTYLSFEEFSYLHQSRQVKSSVTSRPFLLKYFEPAELYYAEPYSAEQLIKIRNNEKPVLYCITAIASRDSSISNTCLIDERNITGQFRRVAKFLNFPFVAISLKEGHFRLYNLRAAIHNLHPAKKDIVVFAYSGHGFSYDDAPRDSFPQLLLWDNSHPHKKEIRANTINIEEVFQQIKAKGARLNLVFSDCCNSKIGMKRLEDSSVRHVKFPPVPWQKFTVLKLFQEAKGSFIFTAAQKGQTAAGNSSLGGFLTHYFIFELDATLRKISSIQPEKLWISIISHAGEYAAKSRAFYDPCDEKPCEQRMVFRMIR